MDKEKLLAGGIKNYRIGDAVLSFLKSGTPRRQEPESKAAGSK
ncbi:hypothetical protein [Propionivibrio sp.]